MEEKHPAQDEVLSTNSNIYGSKKHDKFFNGEAKSSS